MNYNTVLTSFYYLLIYADGSVNAKELSAAKRLVETESIPEDFFQEEISALKLKDRSVLLAEALLQMKRLERSQQIRIIAWMCVLANADGFMDRSEWQLIYQIYHKELSLPLNEIFEVQKDLNRIVWLKPHLSR
jgi:uncharacterized tellurite resistance protein B-like protein